MGDKLLEIKKLKVSFNVGKKKLTAVENVEFSLDQGKIIEHGTHKELLKKNGYYATVYKHQFPEAADAVRE